MNLLTQPLSRTFTAAFAAFALILGSAGAQSEADPVPPLSPVLARTLLKRLGSSATLSDAVLDQLRQYSWPGNIRELRNALIRASVLGDDRIAPEHLPRSTSSASSAARPADAKTEVEETQQDEIDRIRRALRAADGNRSHAAKALGVPRSSLLYRMRKLGLETE